MFILILVTRAGSHAFSHCKICVCVFFVFVCCGVLFVRVLFVLFIYLLNIGVKVAMRG